MLHKSPASRTHFVPPAVSGALCEAVCDSNMVRITHLVEQLPGELSTTEVRDVGENAALCSGVANYMSYERLKTDVIFNLGLVALYGQQDLITAQSTIKVLRWRNIRGVTGAIALNQGLKEIKASILEDITREHESTTQEAPFRKLLMGLYKRA